MRGSIDTDSFTVLYAKLQMVKNQVSSLAAWFVQWWHYLWTKGYKILRYILGICIEMCSKPMPHPFISSWCSADRAVDGYHSKRNMLLNNFLTARLQQMIWRLCSGWILFDWPSLEGMWPGQNGKLRWAATVCDNRDDLHGECPGLAKVSLRLFRRKPHIDLAIMAVRTKR